MDNQTIDVYNDKVEDYANFFTDSNPSKSLSSFMSQLSDGAKVLDLGCGPGHASGQMKNAGFDVVATDASAEMVRLANEKFDLNAKVEVFDDLKAENVYDGVWANFSLLHAERYKFPTHLKQIHTSLKSKGIFHIGMKLGDGEHRDQLGRFYSYFTVLELAQFLNDCGFDMLETTEGKEKGLAGNIDPFVLILAQKI